MLTIRDKWGTKIKVDRVEQYLNNDGERSAIAYRYDRRVRCGEIAYRAVDRDVEGLIYERIYN